MHLLQLKGNLYSEVDHPTIQGAEYYLLCFAMKEMFDTIARTFLSLKKFFYVKKLLYSDTVFFKCFCC